MGRLTWRVQELLFFDSLRASNIGKKLIKDALKHWDENGDVEQTGWFRRAMAYFTNQYEKKFRDEPPFAAETDLEFSYRQKLQPRAVLVRYGAETEEDKEKQLQAVPRVRRL